MNGFLVGGTEDKTETTAVKGDVDGNGVRIVGRTGVLFSDYATYSYGLAPACCII